MCFTYSISMKITMATVTLTLSGNSSELEAHFFPPIELDPSSSYMCALVDFQTYHSIPNVSKHNQNVFISKMKQLIIPEKSTLSLLEECFVDATYQWTDESRKQLLISINYYKQEDVPTRGDLKLDYISTEPYEIPKGSYEIADIINLLKEREPSINISVNKNTGKCSIEISDPGVKIDFTRKNTIRSILGFDSKIIEPNKKYIADHPVNINDINVIRVDCNIASGSYINDKRTHNIHEFYPQSEIGYKLIEVPKNLIYHPVIERVIQYLRINITDQNGELIDFRGETITCRIHIKKE